MESKQLPQIREYIAFCVNGWLLINRKAALEMDGKLIEESGPVEGRRVPGAVDILSDKVN